MTIFQSFYYSASFSCRAVQFSTFNAFQKSSARNAKVPTTLNTFFTLSYVRTLRSYLYMMTAQFKPSFLSFLFISELHHLVVFTTTPPPPRQTPSLWWAVHFWSNGMDKYFTTTYNRQLRNTTNSYTWTLDTHTGWHTWTRKHCRSKQVRFTTVNFVYLF